MRVTVRLYAFLAERVPGARSGSRLELELPEGSTLSDLVARLAVPREQARITVVNGRMQELDHRLQPGDEVGIFPPVAGG